MLQKKETTPCRGKIHQINSAMSSTRKDFGAGRTTCDLKSD